MRGLLQAAILLAPTVVGSLAIVSDDQLPAAFIRLGIPSTQQEGTRVESLLRLNILESELPCGYGNVTVNGQSLSQDAAGLGSGSIATDDDNLLIANWTFSCIDVGDERKEQLLRFQVLFIDGKDVEDVEFGVQFSQKEPVWVSTVEGADAVIKASKPEHGQGGLPEKYIQPDELENEIAELDLLKLQLVELQQAIFMKERFLSEVFGYSEKSSLTECDSLRCVFNHMYDSVKGAASRFYGALDEHHSRFGGHGRGRQGKHHGFFGMPHHSNHTHGGNHTFPPPHHRKPHGPPFCRCGPPPPFHHGPPKHQDDDHGFPDPRFHHGPPPAHPPPHHPSEGYPHTPSPPLFDDEPGRPDKEVPPPSPHEDPDGHRDPSHGDHPPHFAHIEPVGEVQERPLHATEGHFLGSRPSPPGDHRPHGGHRHRPPPTFNFRRFAHTAPLFRVMVVVILLGFLFATLHTRCFTKRRQNSRQEDTEPHPRTRNRLAGLWLRLKQTFVHRNSEDEEKEAIMRRIHEDDDSDSDAMSTTMEQDIEQFRNAADVVSDMIAAEEGRSRRQDIVQYPMVVPPSPTAAFPDYMSQDEALPAYDEGANDPSYVADGIRYSPGISTYTPSISSSQSSLDENLGRKE